MERDVLAAMFELERGGMVQERLIDVVFGGQGKGVVDDTQEALDYMGMAIVSLLPLVIASLEDTASRKASSLVRACFNQCSGGGLKAKLYLTSCTHTSSFGVTIAEKLDMVSLLLDGLGSSVAERLGSTSSSENFTEAFFSSCFE